MVLANMPCRSDKRHTKKRYEERGYVGNTIASAAAGKAPLLILTLILYFEHLH